jgi:lipopolysaccharide heptosyltransferase II
MPLTRRQKNILLVLTEPFFRAFFAAYQVLTMDAFKGHPTTPSKVLVVRLDSIGDVLLSEPAIAALRQRFPRARLDGLVGPAGQAVLAGNPHVDGLLVYEAPWHIAWRGGRVSWLKEIGPLLAILCRLRRERYDLVCELRGDFRDIALAAASGAPIRVGSGVRGGSYLLTQEVIPPLPAHHLEQALAIAQACGAEGHPRPPRLYLGQAELSLAARLLPEEGSQPYVAFHLGSGFPSKCLPVDKFASVARALASQGKHIVLVGGKEEAGLADQFLRLFPRAALNLVGRLSVKETAAVLARCNLFVGNDSGPMHLAAAVGTPVVAAFGPSDPQRYHPWGVPHRVVEVEMDCRPCDLVNCRHEENLCLTRIPAEGLLQAAQELLDSKAMVGPGA